MTAEEAEISRSTAGYRFDTPPPAPPSQKQDAEEKTEATPAYAVDFLENTTNDQDNPVVLFALEWCEFCWSVRKMMAHYEIPYRSVDLDSVEYQRDNRGGDIRAAIREQTGLKTIPQIYIGGKHIGGATEFFDICKDGEMKKLLEKNSITYNKQANVDPYTFLPGWLHSRQG